MGPNAVLANTAAEGYKNVLSKVGTKLRTELEYVEQLSGGMSGAAVFVVNLTGVHAPNQGPYVLKLDHTQNAGSGGEAELHRAALRADSEFSRDHIPSIRCSSRWRNQLAVLYEIAGGSVAALKDLSWTQWTQNQVEAVTASVSLELLSKWNRGAMALPKAIHPTALFRRWLDYRLDDSAIPDLLLRASLDPNPPSFTANGVLLPNPLRFAKNSECWGERSLIRPLEGNSHGDLNVRNILAPVTAQAASSFWLIDFSHYSTSYLLFDQAYLQLSYLLEHWRGRLTEWFDLVRSLASQSEVQAGPANHGFAGFAKNLDNTVETWLTETFSEQPLIADHRRQRLLAQVSAGLNFAHKFGLDDLRRLQGFLYATAYMSELAKQVGIVIPSRDDLPNLDIRRVERELDLGRLVSHSRQISESLELAMQSAANIEKTRDPVLTYLGGRISLRFREALTELELLRYDAADADPEITAGQLGSAMLEVATTRVEAVSIDETEFWSDAAKDSYLESNRRAQSRGCAIKRIFSFRNDKERRKLLPPARVQAHYGVLVRLLPYATMRRLTKADAIQRGPTNLLLVYNGRDHGYVSCTNPGASSLTFFSSNSKDVNRYHEWFARLWKAGMPP